MLTMKYACHLKSKSALAVTNLNLVTKEADLDFSFWPPKPKSQVLKRAVETGTY